MSFSTLCLLAIALGAFVATTANGEYYTSSDHMIILVHISEDVTSQLAYVVKRDEPRQRPAQVSNRSFSSCLAFVRPLR